MNTTKVVAEPIEVHSRCIELFDAEPKELFMIAQASAAARNEKTPFMPNFAGGMLGHIYGVEQLKVTFVKKKGWAEGCVSGVDHVISQKLRRKIMFQNVDVAGSERFEPKSMSPIGDAKRGAVEKEVPFLFPAFEAEEIQRQQRLEAFYTADPWFLCVSYDKEGVPACEISLPCGIEDGRFAPSFVERIFIELPDEFDPQGQQGIDLNPPTDIKPIISRK